MALLTVAAALALAAALSEFGSAKASPAGAVSALASALSSGHVGSLRYANTSGPAAAAAWRALTAGLPSVSVSVHGGKATVRGTEAWTRLRWRWRLPFGHRWSYSTVARLRLIGGRWEPVWSARIVSARLSAGAVLRLSLRSPPRAPIMTSNGQPIIKEQPVVNVGIEPERVRDLRELLAELHADLGVSEAPLLAAVRAASPTAFVPVITLRRAVYEQLRPEIYPLPGTVFTASTLPLAPTHSFAQSLLGVTAPASPAVAKASHGGILTGETVGLSGLEQAFNSRLSGSPGVVVAAVPERPGARPVALYRSAPTPGRPLETTIEVAAQEAADAALSSVKLPSALVAINVQSGELIAVSVGPNPAGYDIALQGEYPPGSTFKVATTLALLERGEQPDDIVDCPAEIVVDGKPFHNAEHEVLGAVSFAQDFANSCNTAFISLAPRVPGEALPVAARTLGIGRKLELGLPSFPGSIPVPAGQVELAAEAFGQGQDLVSPIALAAAAAAIARGRWLPPRLVLSPALPRPAAGPPIPPAIDTTLQVLMRAVVTDGTGSVLADQPGLPVYGKTGTAETGAQDPPRTDAWFIGFQGNIAFAALVADTNNGFGGTLAAPIIGRFLSELNQ